jgi:formylaminopyrimidine deformylase / aminopyrimidine aminohydrolase
MEEEKVKPTDLLIRHADIWHAATHHQFLEAVRDGSLAPNIFATWLVQDYLFVLDELTCQARLLARAPRSGQHILVRGLSAIEAEASWFESHAQQRHLSLDVPHYPTTASYRDLLESLDREPYPVAITAIWAIERAYLEAWKGTMPCNPRYQEYVDHWANVEFERFIADLEEIATTALLESSQVDNRAESTFLKVAQLEHDFWQMAWSGETNN